MRKSASINLEELLASSRCREALIVEQQRTNEACSIFRMEDSDAVQRARRPNDACKTAPAGIDEGPLATVRLNDLPGAVHGVTFDESTQIKRNAPVQESDTATTAIEDYEIRIAETLCFVDLSIRRDAAVARRALPRLHERRKPRRKAPSRPRRVFEGAGHDSEKLVGNGHVLCCCLAVYQSELAALIEPAEHVLQSLEFKHRAVDSLVAAVIQRPNGDFNHRAHQVFGVARFDQLLYNASHINNAFFAPRQNALDERVAPVTPIISEPISRRSREDFPRNWLVKRGSSTSQPRLSRKTISATRCIRKSPDMPTMNVMNCSFPISFRIIA